MDMLVTAPTKAMPLHSSVRRTALRNAAQRPDTPRPLTTEQSLLRRLQRGEPVAFEQLVNQHHGSLIHMAACYVSDRAVAEEVVQDTWIAVIEGLAQFEGRASLRTWIFGILINKAKDRGIREKRCVCFSSLPGNDDDGTDTLEAARSRGTAEPACAWGLGASTRDAQSPEKLLASRQMLGAILDAIDTLPAVLKEVVVMRDIEDMAAHEICTVLRITSNNLHVRLHRARELMRIALGAQLSGISA
jgi:RNA polymerase sigma-70 factor, ECF subfamily